MADELTDPCDQAEAMNAALAWARARPRERRGALALVGGHGVGKTALAAVCMARAGGARLVHVSDVGSDDEAVLEVLRCDERAVLLWVAGEQSAAALARAAGRGAAAARSILEIATEHERECRLALRRAAVVARMRVPRVAPALEWLAVRAPSGCVTHALAAGGDLRGALLDASVGARAPTRDAPDGRRPTPTLSGRQRDWTADGARCMGDIAYALDVDASLDGCGLEGAEEAAAWLVSSIVGLRPGATLDRARSLCCTAAKRRRVVADRRVDGRVRRTTHPFVEPGARI